MKYYRNIETGSIYRVHDSQVSGQSKPAQRLERWNWDMENWNGHIHNYRDTWNKMENGVFIVEITEQEAMSIIKGES